MLVKIFQIKITEEIIKNNPFLIKRLFRESSKEEDKIDLKKNFYEEVYEGYLRLADNVDVALEQVFNVFNNNHPKDYKGRSLSVSDIVYVYNKYYICQPFGWKEITAIN